MNPKNFETEKGGILIGNLFGDYIVITDITFPSSKDRAGFYYFCRNKENAQQQVNRFWSVSDGKMIYLGEWHTHFENAPTPSKVDKAMIKNVLRTSQTETDFLILLIVGYTHIWIGVQRKKGRLQKGMLLNFSRIPYLEEKS